MKLQPDRSSAPSITGHGPGWVAVNGLCANHFTVIETWRDQAALDAHVAAAHTKQYRDDVLPLTGSPLDERVFKAAR